LSPLYPFNAVRSLPSESYEFTLCDEETSLIRCLACRRRSSGLLQIATGGLQLKLWTQTIATGGQQKYAKCCFFYDQKV